MPQSVLILSPRASARAFLTRALGGSFAVLPAANREEALCLMRERPGCRVALCEMGADAAGELATVQDLKTLRPGLAVVALLRQPCGDTLPLPVRQGLCSAVCTLPMRASALQEEIRHLLRDAPAPRAKRHVGILTREEIDFLLGRGDAFADAACQPAQ
ncbi:hypothetical protein [Solidesulfovibrio alcoholivorans]|uniref:hypothetical protein n=1 Tax=Solidesulfovibrio alcoholivorans TaxID=81406 RepID=UPI000693359C|nr:hypothetical protein [Solidesulfovibrio alcoholivorans]